MLALPPQIRQKTTIKHVMPGDLMRALSHKEIIDLVFLIYTFQSYVQLKKQSMMKIL